MFRDVEELKTISDEEFNRISKKFYNKVDKYVSNNIVNQYLAHFIGNGYKMSSLWSADLKAIIEHGLNELIESADKGYDIKKVKSILVKDYGLKIIDDNPAKIVEVNIERSDVK